MIKILEVYKSDIFPEILGDLVRLPDTPENRAKLDAVRDLLHSEAKRIQRVVKNQFLQEKYLELKSAEREKDTGRIMDILNEITEYV